jgi:dethiobiotin synthetase
MIRLRLPVLLVARPGVGTLNHTLLSLHALHGAGLTVMGVILNQATPGRWGRIEEDNVRTIERLGGVKVLACVRYGEMV